MVAMDAENRRHSRRNSSNDLRRYLNAETAKVIAIFFIMCFISYHGFLHLYYGNDSCKWLLSDGRFQGYSIWQPYGCMIHRYTPSDARNCMHYISYWGGHNHMVFMGDSRVRQLYHEFVSLFTGKPPPKYKKHGDMSYRDELINLKVKLGEHSGCSGQNGKYLCKNCFALLPRCPLSTMEFLWMPYVDSAMYNLTKRWSQGDPRERPKLVITGSALWSIRYMNDSTKALRQFKANLTSLCPHIEQMQPTTKYLWVLQDPVDESRLSPNRSMISNEWIDVYNRAAIDVLEHSAAELWSSSRLITQGYNEDMEDGLHIGRVALNWDGQIVLNHYCNDYMAFNDGTCCSSGEAATGLQIFTAFFFISCLFITVIIYCYRRYKYSLRRTITLQYLAEHHIRYPASDLHDPPAPTPAQPDYFILFLSLSKLGIIMAYFYLCDRTTFFMKENRAFTFVNFLLPLAYLMVLGFFFTENTDETSVMNRRQTDEWKGWMQVVILIYHITGASQVLFIYMHIRVLVSCYLFLSGFGQFYYFWIHADFSLHRFCKVLFRLNMLLVALCCTMNRPYQYYYFVPLVSFWFLVLYLVLACPPRVTSNTTSKKPLLVWYILLKLAGLAALVTWLSGSEVVFEQIFLTQPLKSLFVSLDDSLHEWRFRWQLDRYSVIYGALFSLLYLLMKKRHLLGDSGSKELVSFPVRWLMATLALAGFVFYSVFILFCDTKEECNQSHAYMVIVPIICYMTLRNVFTSVRERYSTFFAWFGRISLELFIAQYHIWLAADSHGTLVLVPNNQLVNIIVITFIFLCISHEIHKITAVLADFAVPDEWPLVLRNGLIFLGAMIILAYSKGVFVW